MFCWRSFTAFRLFVSQNSVHSDPEVLVEICIVAEETKLRGERNIHGLVLQIRSVSEGIKVFNLFC